MNTDRHQIEVSGIGIEVVRKEIKNLHIGVYPPSGRVRVAAPLSLGDDALRLAVISRLGWIRKQQSVFSHQDRQSQREMVTGESHYFQGHRYLLDVIEQDCPPAVSIINNSTIQIRVRPGSDRNVREQVLYKWYRRKLRMHLPPLVAKWEAKIGTPIEDLRIRKMKTRWGSCNADDKRILINLELAKKPASCVEYILVHEMVHFLERRHTDRFRDLMDTFLPSWRIYCDELNQAPLAHEDWGY